MTAQTTADILDFMAVPSATLMPLLYALTARWYRTLIGWAIITSTVGLALLVDASALFRIFGPNYTHRQEVVLIAFAVIVVGSWLYLFAFARVRYLNHRYREVR